jgi:hypothetical protein
MNYKEKYEEALERARQIHNEGKAQCFDVMTKVFPELAEVDGEWIKKNLITFFKDDYGTNSHTYFAGMKVKDIITWLEKQGKQEEPQVYEIEDGKILTYSETDGYNVFEPKFKVGDWVVDEYVGDAWHIDSIDKKNYHVSNEIGDYNYFPILDQDKMYLWTIQDAKPGDILATNNFNIFIYRKHDNNYVYYYFSTNYYDNISLNSSWNIFGIKPATKEQCDFLFQKMKKDGYEWNAEKKELKEIEQNLIQETKPFEPEHGKYYYCIKNYFWGGKKQASKGDVIQALRGLPIMGLKDASEYFLPVNSIKQKHAWSKEDEHWRQQAIDFMKHPDLIKATPTLVEHIIDWLKSLRPRSTWKPSEEQLEALDSATENCACSEYQDCLRELIEQLKKLRKE